ncbi:MAG: dTDP-4-dehydrorhamnose reductase [Deltaproteobacteria bacterium]|nr:dTDP-4-dehydrorhamnose reductase [Deltaproteobacteria bacterium]
MSVLVTGGGGLVGSALGRRGGVTALTHRELDICDPAAIASQLGQHAPRTVINAAAQANVDRAEQDPEAAFAINATAPGELAAACAQRGIRMLHLSTDYVFGGNGERRPHREDDPVAPVGVYCESKAEGERRVRASGGTVVRTAWVFGEHGRGFVQLVLARLAAGERVEITGEQHGCPTWVEDLVDVLLALAARDEVPGILHACGDPGISRYDFARAIAVAAGADPDRVVRVEGAPAGAPRPAWSVLDASLLARLRLGPRPWAPGLARVIG